MEGVSMRPFAEHVRHFLRSCGHCFRCTLCVCAQFNFPVFWIWLLPSLAVDAAVLYQATVLRVRRGYRGIGSDFAPRTGCFRGTVSRPTNLATQAVVMTQSRWWRYAAGHRAHPPEPCSLLAASACSGVGLQHIWSAPPFYQAAPPAHSFTVALCSS